VAETRQRNRCSVELTSVVGVDEEITGSILCLESFGGWVGIMFEG
jgi:hypothetical protein